MWEKQGVELTSSSSFGNIDSWWSGDRRARQRPSCPRRRRHSEWKPPTASGGRCRGGSMFWQFAWCLKSPSCRLLPSNRSKNPFKSIDNKVETLSTNPRQKDPPNPDKRSPREYRKRNIIANRAVEHESIIFAINSWMTRFLSSRHQRGFPVILNLFTSQTMNCPRTTKNCWKSRRGQHREKLYSSYGDCVRKFMEQPVNTKKFNSMLFQVFWEVRWISQFCL